MESEEIPSGEEPTESEEVTDGEEFSESEESSVSEEFDESVTEPTESESSSDDGKENGTQPADEDLSELEKRLQEAIAVRDACQAELDCVIEKWQECQSENRSIPDFSGEDLEKKNWESQRTALERKVEGAQWEYEDSLRRKQKALEDAQRRIDDAVAPENVQDTLTLYQLELSYEKEVLSRYRKLLENGGEVFAEESGVVTGVNVSAGNNTPDGAAVVYAAKDSDLKFQTTLTKEDKKYVNQGTEGNLEFGTLQETLSVDYLELLGRQLCGGYFFAGGYRKDGGERHLRGEISV